MIQLRPRAVPHLTSAPVWQCSACNILVPAERDVCPRGHRRGFGAAAPPPPSGPDGSGDGPQTPASAPHDLGPVPPPVEARDVGDGSAGEHDRAGATRRPSGAAASSAPPPPPTAAAPQAAPLEPVQVPQASPVEEADGPFLALRLSKAGEALNSVRYPCLDASGEPVMWENEELASTPNTVDSLGSGVLGRVRRHGGAAQVLLTNRRLLVVSTTAPSKHKGWQDRWGSEPRPTPTDRLMGHALWEWVAQIKVRAAVAGPSVEVVMSTMDGDAPSLVLSFAARGASAEQRAQQLAGAIADVATAFAGANSRRQDSTWFFENVMPVGQVR